MEKQVETRIKGIIRVKKFDADQDETVEEPQEIMEKEFKFTEEQAKQFRSGGKVIINENEEINVIGE